MLTQDQLDGKQLVTYYPDRTRENNGEPSQGYIQKVIQGDRQGIEAEVKSRRHGPHSFWQGWVFSSDQTTA